jgi:hypothetical protein
LGNEKTFLFLFYLLFNCSVDVLSFTYVIIWFMWSIFQRRFGTLRVHHCHSIFAYLIIHLL